ncbi:MAG: MotA/TolQ/ExbB proton channel family protein [Rhodoferax sp.]|nr:MotA/TolQ/ExbB proton channel family protein [Rhodoferax sp.]
MVRLIGIVACAAGLLFSFSPGSVQAQSAAPAAIQAVSQAQPAVAVAAAKTETAENPYGIESLWKTSDAVAKTVLLLLLVMSVSSWYVTVVKLLEQSKMSRQARAAAKDFWPAGTIEQGALALEANSPYRFIADAGTNALKKHDGLMGHIPLNDWVSMSIARAVDRIQSNTQGGLAVLATVGSISPFVGLFGTVWGIYHALTAIGISGQASIDKVAGPVGEALIMTAIGLAVAVPAVLAYNWLVRRNKGVMDDVRAFSQDLHSVVLGAVNKG